MKINSQLIADLCGVSRGTVDRALNGRSGVNPETKEKIVRFAKELGYRPHFVAQSLVKGRTMSLGIVVFDIDNRIFAQIINAMELRARELKYFVYVTFTHKDPETELDCIHHLFDRKVDGIALLSVNKGKKFESALKKLNVPVITFGNRISEAFPYVWINDRQAIKDAVQLISSKGYEELIFIIPPLSQDAAVNVYSPMERYAGFVDIGKHISGIKTSVIKEYDYLSALERIMSGSSKRKAVLCNSDLYAFNVLNFLRENHVRIPEEVGVIGFDNIDTIKYITPSLTSVDYSAKDIGTEIANQLVDLINGNPVAPTTLLDHRIVMRNSL